ncbi:hypothetical protein TVAG_483380 [Trichomonas vaginalis G3]|uniref:Uncharacterized protein n=1 Tax=Trichomonas vaginalis (strain ATCC PRA-98 / G3) TaxID=412133 RepID=A2ETB0_TRIV3|nr:hypothetical protein TVAGG3_0620340 [Trichomonas vaginalis G3]EAY04100.1 hypothetical protein TVAG_483380 [Trichomonas vaginalis G3]KAI5503850.1 hypothetical protein TVAGG3_0620340 [Trichomonas vaginalis G3]|eukprot:XP_001316323.1 hypothetical protein [Trichomonas vaginalis G3]
MGILEKFLSILSKRSKDDNSISSQITNSVAGMLVKAFICDEDLLGRFGIPFKVEHSMISDIKFINSGQNGNEKPKISIENVNLSIFADYFQDNTTKEQFDMPDYDLVINNLSISVISNENKKIIELVGNNVQFFYRIGTTTLIQFERFHLFNDSRSIINLENLNFEMDSEFTFVIKLNEAKMALEHLQAILLHSTFKDFFKHHSITFNINQLEADIDYSSSVIFKDFIFKYTDKIEFSSSEISINISSYMFTIENTVLKGDILTLQNFISNSKQLIITKLTEIPFCQVSIGESFKVKIPSLKIESTIKYVHDFKKTITNNSIISLLNQIHFIIEKFNVEFLINDKEDIFHLNGNVTANLDTKNFELNIDDFVLRCNNGYPIVSGIYFHINQKENSRLNIQIPKTEVFLIYQEVDGFLRILNGARELIDFSALDIPPKISFNNLYFYLCFEILKNERKPAINVSFKFHKIEFSKLNHMKVRLVFEFQSAFYNIATSKENIILSPTKIESSFSLDQKTKDLVIDFGKLNFYLSLSGLRLLNKCITQPVLHQNPSCLVINDTVEPIFISGTDGQRILIESQKKVQFSSTKMTLYKDEKELTYTLSEISFPMFVWPNCIMSVSSENCVKIIHFVSLFIIENSLCTRIFLHSKNYLNRQLITFIDPGCRVPISYLDKTASFYFSGDEKVASRAHSFNILDRQDLIYALPTKNGEMQVMIKTFQDNLTKSMIIHVRSRLQLVNNVPNDLLFVAFNDIYQTTKVLKPGESEFISISTSSALEAIYLILSDVIDGHRSRQTRISLTTSEPQEVLIDNNRFYVQYNEEKLVLSVFCSIYVKNKTLLPITMKGNNGNILVPLKSDLMIPSDRYMLPHSSFIIRLNDSPVKVTTTVEVDVNYTIQVTTYTKNNTKFVEFQDLFIISNKLKIGFSIIAMTEQRVSPDETTPLRIFGDRTNGFSLKVGEYYSANVFCLTSPCATTLQLMYNDNRMLVDLTIVENEGTMIATISNPRSRPRFAIVNDTEFDLFAQQLEEVMPLLIEPHSSSIYGFDTPSTSTEVILTIEGISNSVDFSSTQFSSFFSRKIANTRIYVSVYTTECGVRIMYVGGQYVQPELDVSIRIIVPNITLNLVNEDLVSFIGFSLSDINCSLARSHLSILSTLNIAKLQIDDHINDKTVLVTNGHYFINFAGQFATFPPSIENMTEFSLALGKIYFGLEEKYMFSAFEYFKVLYDILPKLPKERRLYIMSSSISPTEIEGRIEKAPEESTRQIVYLHNSLPVSLKGFLPGISVKTFCGSFETFISILYNMTVNFYDNMNRSLQNPPQSQAKYEMSIPYADVNGFEELKGFIEQPFDPLVGNYLMFNGFPQNKQVVVKTISTFSQVKVGQLYDNSIQEFPSILSETPTITKQLSFPMGTIKLMAPEERLMSRSEIPATKKRGQLRAAFNFRNGVLAVYKKCVVTRIDEKEIEYAKSSIRNITRDGVFLKMEGLKPKDPTFSIEFCCVDDVEVPFNILRSISLEYESNYFIV